MKNITRIAKTQSRKLCAIALVAVIGFAFVSCDTPEEKAAQKAADNLLKTLGGTDTAAIQEALATAGQAGLTTLTNTSASPLEDFSYDRFTSQDTGKEFIRILGYKGNSGLVIVPAEIEGLPVEVVTANSFAGSGTDDVTGKFVEGNGGERITVVVLPDSIRAIGGSAFRNCTNLHTINIPAGMTHIGDSVFKGCENLYNLTIPESLTAVQTINRTDKGFFDGCQKLPSEARERVKALGYTGNF